MEYFLNPSCVFKQKLPPLCPFRSGAHKENKNMILPLNGSIRRLENRQPRKISHLPAKTVKSVTAPAKVTSKRKKSNLSGSPTQVEETSLLFLGTWWDALWRFYAFLKLLATVNDIFHLKYVPITHSYAYTAEFMKNNDFFLENIQFKTQILFLIKYNKVEYIQMPLPISCSEQTLK